MDFGKIHIIIPQPPPSGVIVHLSERIQTALHLTELTTNTDLLTAQREPQKYQTMFHIFACISVVSQVWLVVTKILLVCKKGALPWSPTSSPALNSYKDNQ